jgi:hypothetical protein
MCKLPSFPIVLDQHVTKGTFLKRFRGYTDVTSMDSAIAADQLVSLVYVSSGVRQFAETEIAEILAQARRNNQRSGLTGMLLYRDGNFLQVLEGTEGSVKAAMQRIERDDRHRGILVMKQGAITERRFSQWQMAFRDISLEGLKEIEGYSPFMETSFETDEFRSKPDFAYRMLLQFKSRLR